MRIHSIGRLSCSWEIGDKEAKVSNSAAPNPTAVSTGGIFICSNATDERINGRLCGPCADAVKTPLAAKSPTCSSTTVIDPLRGWARNFPDYPVSIWRHLGSRLPNSGSGKDPSKCPKVRFGLSSLSISWYANENDHPESFGNPTVRAVSPDESACISSYDGIRRNRPQRLHI